MLKSDWELQSRFFVKCKGEKFNRCQVIHLKVFLTEQESVCINYDAYTILTDIQCLDIIVILISVLYFMKFSCSWLL
jgi:hypothetical protein